MFQEDEAPPARKVSLYTTLVIISVCMTEGFTLGYYDSLMDIFRTKGVDSSHLGQLSLMIYPFVFAFIGAPIVDKYYSVAVGKRKTYLIPCKLIIGSALIVFSLYVNQAVQENQIWKISSTMFFIGLVQIFDFNAVAGLRYEIYGVENTGMASFTFYTGIVLGMFFGYQLFIMLNSHYVCVDILGLSGSIVTHQMGNIFFGVCNILSGVLVIFVEEPAPTENKQKSISPLTMLKTFIRDPLYKRSTLWLMFSVFGAMSLRQTVTISMINRGFRREHAVMLGFINTPFVIMANFILKRFLIPGKILRRCTYLIFLYLVFLYIDWFNIVTFDKERNYNQGVMLFFAGIFLEGLCTWVSYHVGFINATAFKHQAATYQTSYMGLVNLGKILPVTLVVIFLDSFNYTLLFVGLNALNMALLIFMYPLAKKVDETPIEDYNKVIQKLTPPADE